jgi:hypothetical protein
MAQLRPPVIFYIDRRMPLASGSSLFEALARDFVALCFYGGALLCFSFCGCGGLRPVNAAFDTIYVATTVAGEGSQATLATVVPQRRIVGFS